MTTEATVQARTCLRCGYDLRALEAARCPECGLPFDPTAPPPAAVPWLRRRQIGYVLPYFGTVFLVVLRPRAFAEQAWRWTQIDSMERDGESFRRVTVSLATLSFTLAGLIVSLAHSQGMIAAKNNVLYWLLALPPLLAFLWIATLRVGVKMPHAGLSVEKRFAVLQNFCCAGLGLSPMLILAAGLLALAVLFHLNEAPFELVLIGMLILIVLAWLGGCGMYLFFGGRVSSGRLVAAVVGSMGLWLMAVVAALVVSLATMAILKPFVGEWP